MITAELTWDDDDHASVKSVEELDELLDHLPFTVRADLPFTVECQVNDETCLMITLGGNESHVEFYSMTERPPIAVCLGPWNDGTFVPFYRRWRYSEVERQFFVPLADAREALRRYVRTGERPDNIAWNDEMINDTPEQVAAHVRTFEGNNWSNLWERARGLSPSDQEQLFTYLVADMRLADEEKQTRIIDLMLHTDRTKALPYIDTFIQTTTSADVRHHVCWAMDGWADARWIPLLSRIVREDPDIHVRRAAIIALPWINDPQVDLILDAAKQQDRGEFLE